MDGINLYRDLRTGTQYIGNWASRDCFGGHIATWRPMGLSNYL